MYLKRGIIVKKVNFQPTYQGLMKNLSEKYVLIY